VATILNKSTAITFTPSSTYFIRKLIGMEQMPTRLGIEYAPCIVKISANTPNKIRMWGRNVIESVKRLANEVVSGAAGGLVAYKVPTTETKDTTIATTSTPYHGVSFGGGNGCVEEGVITGGGGILLLHDTCFVC
jgi:hypothetical protein